MMMSLVYKLASSDVATDAAMCLVSSMRRLKFCASGPFVLLSLEYEAGSSSKCFGVSG